MLKQTINLYADFNEKSKDTSFFSRNHLIASWIIFAFLSLLLYIGTLVQLHLLNQDYTKLTKQATQLQQKFIQLKSAYPPIFFTQEAETSLKQVADNIAAREKILRSVQDNIPFSTFLGTFAFVIVPNVWLTDINIQQSGDNLLIKGQTSDKQDLHVFLQAIQKDNLFNQYKIESQEIGGTDENTSSQYLHFQINLAKKQHE